MGIGPRPFPSPHKGPLAPTRVDSFVQQHGALTTSVLSPQQFPQDAEYRQRKTMHIGGSTSIHYNLKGAFSISTSIGPGAHASTAQGGRSRISRSIKGTGFYQRRVNN